MSELWLPLWHGHTSDSQAEPGMPLGRAGEASLGSASGDRDSRGRGHAGDSAGRR